MKYLHKLILVFFINFYSVNSFGQYNKKEITEIKQIFIDYKNQDLILPFYYINNRNIIFPNAFTSCKKFYSKLILSGNWSKFVPSKKYNLNIKDCDFLNSMSINDDSEIKIDIDLIANNDKIILYDSINNSKTYESGGFVKPLFFRNYKICFITIYYSDSMESFFLKKINKHWKFDKFYLRVEYDKHVN